VQAQIAQLVEHAIENRSVAGSIPALGTIFLGHLVETHFYVVPFSWASISFKSYLVGIYACLWASHPAVLDFVHDFATTRRFRLCRDP
jgi:hypothetical protein